MSHRPHIRCIALVAAIAALATIVIPCADLVLCVGDDGHLALETRHDGAPCAHSSCGCEPPDGATLEANHDHGGCQDLSSIDKTASSVTTWVLQLRVDPTTCVAALRHYLGDETRFTMVSSRNRGPAPPLIEKLTTVLLI